MRNKIINEIVNFSLAVDHFYDNKEQDLKGIRVRCDKLVRLTDEVEPIFLELEYDGYRVYSSIRYHGRRYEERSFYLVDINYIEEGEGTSVKYEDPFYDEFEEHLEYIMKLLGDKR